MQRTIQYLGRTFVCHRHNVCCKTGLQFDCTFYDFSVYNWCEVKAKMWILNLGKPVNIPVLNEQMAIELGANLLSESIIFIIAAVILVSEYNRYV